MLCRLMLSWQMFAGGDVSLMLGWQLLVGGDVMYLDFEISVAH